jgi:heat shock protein HtpX
MATLYTHQTENVFKTWLLMGMFFGLVIVFGFFLSQYYDSSAILYAFVGFSVLMNFYSYWFSDKLVLRLTGAKEATRAEYFDLYNSVENLAITAGLPKPKVYIINDRAPNAFATGRNKEHAVVAVTTGLLAVLNKTELEGVLAHELSHIGNRDMLVGMVAVVLAGFIAIAANVFLRSGFRGNNNKNGGPIVLIGIALAILAPIFATLLQLAVSRKREFLADASGALLTRYPEGLANALLKIQSHSQPMEKANNATAHLFIANPFGAKAGKGFSKLWMTHPPIEERVAALRES